MRAMMCSKDVAPNRALLRSHCQRGPRIVVLEDLRKRRTALRRHLSGALLTQPNAVPVALAGRMTSHAGRTLDAEIRIAGGILQPRLHGRARAATAAG